MGEMAGALAGVGTAITEGAEALTSVGTAIAEGANGKIQDFLSENEADINNIKHDSSQMLKKRLQNPQGYDHKNNLVKLMNTAASQSAQTDAMGEASAAESMNNAMASHERAKAEFAELMKMSQNSAQNNMG